MTIDSHAAQVTRADPRTHELLASFAATVRLSRRTRRWTQQRLASEVGISQSHVVRLERAEVPELSFRLAQRVLGALDARSDIRFMAIGGAAPSQRDRAHARCVAYVARRLERSGWLVATEVDIGGERWRGFADVIAFHPGTRVLLVVEVKTEIHDVGDIDRQLGVAEQGSWAAAGRRGWRPRAVTSALLVLATDENDRRLMANRAYFDRACRHRHANLRATIANGTPPLERGQRALAMVDPRSRRSAWLIPTWLDGRRTPARYADRSAYLAG